MKLLGFYITRVDYKHFFDKAIKYLDDRNIKVKIEQDSSGKTIYFYDFNSETFTGTDGRLRYKHNGQFAPDDRSQFKKTHDALRAEVIAREFEGVPDWGDLKTAYRNEEFGR